MARRSRGAEDGAADPNTEHRTVPPVPRRRASTPPRNRRSACSRPRARRGRRSRGGRRRCRFEADSRARSGAHAATRIEPTAISIESSDAGGAPRSQASTSRMGSPWLTSAMRAPEKPRHSARIAPTTRACTDRCDSPLGARAAARSRLNSCQRGSHASSRHVFPVHSPKSISSSAGQMLTGGRRFAAAMSAAVRGQ